MYESPAALTRMYRIDFRFVVFSTKNIIDTVSSGFIDVVVEMISSLSISLETFYNNFHVPFKLISYISSGLFEFFVVVQYLCVQLRSKCSELLRIVDRVSVSSQHDVIQVVGVG